MKKIFLCYLISLSSAQAGLAPESYFIGSVDGFDEKEVFVKQGQNVYKVPHSEKIPRFLREGQQIVIPIDPATSWQPMLRPEWPPHQQKRPGIFTRNRFGVCVVMHYETQDKTQLE